MQVSFLLSKLRKLHLVWFWSGNWPLLDDTMMADNAFERRFRKISGTSPRISIGIHRNSIVTEYHSEEDYSRLEDYFLDKFERNPNFIHESVKNYQKETQKDVEALHKISKSKFQTLSNRKLSDLFLQARKHFEYNSAIDHYTWYMEKFFVPMLEKFVYEYLCKKGDPSLLSEYMSLLVTPERPSQYAREREDFFALVKAVKRNKALVRTIQNSTRIEAYKEFPSLKKRILSHLNKYVWISVLVNNPPTREQDIWKELKVFLKEKDAHFMIKSRRIGDKVTAEILTDKKRVLKYLNPQSKIKSLIKGLEAIAYVRTEDNAVMGHLTYLVIPLYTEVARRLGLTYYELKEFRPWEIVSLLRCSLKVQTKDLKSRQNLLCRVKYKGKEFTLTGKDARSVSEIVVGNKGEKRAEKSVFRGTPASAGVTKGKARVTLSSKEANSVLRGEILIAPATSADFVPAMRKAGAVVTEFGGITSHASVVSREFNIPCIVGVSEITKHIKSGQTVSVDANTGTITIVK